MQNTLERSFRNQVYEQFAEVCKAFANARRLEILELLAQGEHSVEELARKTGVSVASASQHLQNLKTAHLVVVRREGVKAHYSLADERVCRVFQIVYELSEDLVPQIPRLILDYAPARTAHGLVSFETLLEGLKSGAPLLIDVRPEKEYFSGHIAGAVSMPLDDLADHLERIPDGAQVVAYCRGAYSLLADEAVAFLSSHGIHAKRLELGFLDWKLEGFPIEFASDYERR